jgi:hypothetical protein
MEFAVADLSMKPTEIAEVLLTALKAKSVSHKGRKIK